MTTADGKQGQRLKPENLPEGRPIREPDASAARIRRFCAAFSQPHRLTHVVDHLK
jgi:hypothetical protein